MSRKIIIAAALLVGFGTAAFGQGSDDLLQGDQVEGPQAGSSGSVGVSGEGSDTGSVPPGWDGAIADALFADEGAGTLRSQQEVQENWDKLSGEQQASVREYCAGSDVAQTGSSGDGEANVTTGSTQGQAQGGNATGDAREPAPTRASLIRLCEWVAEM